MDFKLVSINGRVITAGKAEKFTGHEHGAYESFRLHKGRVFLLDEHFDRLKKSLAALNIDWDDDREKYYLWIAELCQEVPENKDVFVRFSVTVKNDKRDVVIYGAYIDFFSPRTYEAVTFDKTHLSKPEYFKRTGFRIKTADYIKGSMDIRKSAGLAEGMDGILLTTEGHVAEALTANVIWSNGNKLFTPPLYTGILAGTMRGYLMKNYSIEEILASPEELEMADEIILTSGASYLRPLGKLNGLSKPGADGAVFKRLYKNLIEDIDRLSKPLS